MKDGITAINATKNRDSLYEALPTWYNSRIDEIIVVDWSSEPKIIIPEEYSDKKS